MKLSSFDPHSKRMETRILRLPDLPALESLEHLFSSAKPSLMMGSPYYYRSRYAEVFTAESTTTSSSTRTSTTATSLRLTKSFTTGSNKKKSTSRVPRRCFSNPSLSRKLKQDINNKTSFIVTHNTANDSMMVMTGIESGSWKSTTATANTTTFRRSPSRRSLSHALHAFTGLLQKAKRSSTVVRNKQQWHNETWFEEMRMSTEEEQLERPTKKKRVGGNGTAHTENWWASSPPVRAC
ncbi:hypothetical protein BDA99DRAFT_29852 [Phascolomyces articulosus]|uniref:Uncharacterized protein n=1 Tax=Phascolomyces articulosus TaxID=60185 RepID=A0AAD5K2N3_9FUNG|nr:hypothetical protein BDA99DRAFT_29852 [Phascolomyces articulosus]